MQGQYFVNPCLYEHSKTVSVKYFMLNICCVTNMMGYWMEERHRTNKSVLKVNL